MMQIRRMKGLAVLLSMCVLMGMINTNAYANDDITESDYYEEEIAFPSDVMKGAEVVSGSAIYVGGPDATDSSDGSRENPFRTLSDAAASINFKGPGSYDIIMLGDTLETSTVYLGNGGEIDISITTEAVSGGAITVSKGFNNSCLLNIIGNTTLTVEGSSAMPLIFDGKGEDYKGEFALIMVNTDATLNLNSNTSAQNNINTSTDNDFQGGGITNYGTVNINGGSISNNKCRYGGGIYNYGNLTFNNGNVSFNHSNYSGGGIYNHVGKNFILNDGIIANNSTNSSGAGIDNRGNMTMNGGTITQNIGNCFDNSGIVTMYKGEIISNMGEATIINYGDGTFHMIDGRISSNSYRYSFRDYMAIYVAGGVFNFSGGSIDNNTGEKIVEASRGSFHMTGGTISNNTASAVVYTYPEGTFTMSDGGISNNTGKVFNLSGPISLSDNASISAEAGEPGKALLNLEYDACINVSGLLTNIASISIEINRPRAGLQILAGPMLTDEIRAKFVIEDSNYYMDDAGRLVFKGTPVTFYVDKAGSDESSVSGSSSDPLLTIQEAVKRIGTSRGTIIIQSELDLVEPVYIYTDITIKSDNETRVISPNVPFSYDYSSIFIVEDGTLTLGDKGQSEGELVIDFNKQKEVLVSFIDNRDIMNLYDRAVIRNAKFAIGTIQNVEAVTNIDGGSLYSIQTAICNLMGTVNMVSGTISGYDNKSTGIYNQDKTAIVNMSGGTITDFEEGIYNLGTLNILGGLIRNNTIGINNIAYTYGTYYEGTLNISGGTIRNNTYGIKSAGNFHMSHNPSIPIGADNSNGIYLTEKAINLGYDLFLSSDKQMLIVLDEFKLDDIVLTGNSASIEDSHNYFVLSDSNYGISEKGTIKYIGKPPIYYVDRNYYTGDSDGSFDRPYRTLYEAVNAIDNAMKVGIIYICSDLEAHDISIFSDITILNYGPDPHTISTDSYNSMFRIYETGSLTLGCEEDGNDVSPNLHLTGTARRTIVDNSGILKLYSGVKMYYKDDYDAKPIAVRNTKSFTMYGGVITGYNSSQAVGGVANAGSFTMEGGIISNCTGSKAGALYNTGTFIMRDGRIEESYSGDGVGIYNNGTIHLSEHASIPMKDDGSNKLMLDEKSVIHIDGNLSSTDSVIIALVKYYPERQVLQGDKMVLLNNYHKFLLDPTVTDYRLSEDGILKYIGLRMDYYVDEEKGEDSNTGTKDLPFATIKKAVEAIGNGVGTIHICSDIDLKEIITIDGAIQLINEGEPHVILRNPTHTGYLFSVSGQLELGNSELNGGPEARLLTINGNKENVKIVQAMIYNNGGRIILHNGIVLEDNYSMYGTIYNYRGSGSGGSLIIKGGVIQNNVAIYNGGGIYNEKGNVTILGGSIRDNEALDGGGIYLKEGSINISGGKINNNKAGQGGGLSLNRSVDNIISGGEIFGNTGRDRDRITLGKGINLEESTLIIRGNASIASDNEISLANYAYVYDISYVYVGGPMSKDIPVITLVKYNDEYPDHNYVYLLGEQVIRPAKGYTLTAQDLSKFQMLDSNYGINSQGKIAANLSDSWFSLIDANNIIYTGREIRPAVVGVNGTTSLIEGRDYQVTYTDNINPGIASVYITGMGNYGGTVIKSFTIKNLSPWSPYTPPSEGGVPVPTPIPDGTIREGGRILLDPDVLRAARASEKDISISIKDEDGKERYTWSFSGRDLAASDKTTEELDLSIRIQRVEEHEDIAKLLGNSHIGGNNQSGLIIHFGHHGDLPAQASIRIYIGDMGYSEGDKLYLYYYNSETGKLDTLPYSSNYVVDKDGYITVNIVHCSEYVLIPKQARTGIITSLRNQISVNKKKITLALGSKKKSTATIQVNLPTTLEQVESFKDKTSASAVGAVRFTYKSSNSKVASVDSAGKITAKKTGKADITVKATLYSGKTKTFKVSVTVKKG